ncbi:MAG: ribonuclease P protein component [Aquiluna sp.]|nr:ribonuclease P protein component [Aquiluna sp.]
MLARPNRLTSGVDIRQVIKSGRRSSNKIATIHFLPASIAAFAIVTSRAVGNAVVRNRLRRRTKAIISTHLDSLQPVRAVIRYRAGASELAFDELTEKISELLKRVNQ